VLNHRECRSVYWEQDALAVMRGTWFRSNDGLAQPIEESLATVIEDEHVTKAWQLVENHRRAHAAQRQADKKAKSEKVVEIHRLSMVQSYSTIWSVHKTEMLTYPHALRLFPRLSDGSIRFGTTMSLSSWSGNVLYRGYATVCLAALTLGRLCCFCCLNFVLPLTSFASSTQRLNMCS
jgi:hypothetical protein